MIRKTKKKLQGFTLTEMLVVVGIIVALTAIAIPVGNRALRSSRKSACLGNLRQIGVGLESWLQDHNNVMPELAAGRSNKNEDVPVLDTLLVDYVSTPDVFRCPEDRELFTQSASSYLWNTTQNGRHKAQLSFFGATEASRIPLVTDKESWHGDEDGVNILYGDYAASGKFTFSTSH